MVKKPTFCKLLYHRKCKRRGVGGQKKPNLVNVVCERPLAYFSLIPYTVAHTIDCEYLAYFERKFTSKVLRVTLLLGGVHKLRFGFF